MPKLNQTEPSKTPSGPNGRAQGKIKIAERVAAELRRDIVTGKLRPGDRLHNERACKSSSAFRGQPCAKRFACSSRNP